MDSAIPLHDQLGARSEVSLHTAPEMLRTGSIRRTLGMIDPVVRLRAAAGT